MHATRTTTYKARERCTPPKHQLQGGARCYSRRGEVPDRWRHRRHPRGTCRGRRHSTGAGARGRRTGSLGYAAGEAGVRLHPESKQGQGAAESPQQRKERPGSRPPRLILNQVSELDSCWRLLQGHRQEGPERFCLTRVPAPIPVMGTSPGSPLIPVTGTSLGPCPHPCDGNLTWVPPSSL